MGLTLENRRLGAQRANEVIAAKRAERRRQMVKVAELLDGLEREDVTELAFAAIVKAGLAAAEADLAAITTPLELQRLVETMATAQKIMRLELGESTSNAANLHVDVTDVEARRAELLARLHALDVESTTVDGMSPTHATQDGNPPPS